MMTDNRKAELTSWLTTRTWYSPRNQDEAAEFAELYEAGVLVHRPCAPSLAELQEYEYRLPTEEE